MVTDFLGAFQDHRQMYIVMEHCVGGDLLEQLLREGRAMTEKRVAQEVSAVQWRLRHVGFAARCGGARSAGQHRPTAARMG
jgi:hypothetical protein